MWLEPTRAARAARAACCRPCRMKSPWLKAIGEMVGSRSITEGCTLLVHARRVASRPLMPEEAM
jgi:hypothetical protein